MVLGDLGVGRSHNGTSGVSPTCFSMPASYPHPPAVNLHVNLVVRWHVVEARAGEHRTTSSTTSTAAMLHAPAGGGFRFKFFICAILIYMSVVLLDVDHVGACGGGLGVGSLNTLLTCVAVESRAPEPCAGRLEHGLERPRHASSGDESRAESNTAIGATALGCGPRASRCTLTGTRTPPRTLGAGTPTQAQRPKRRVPPAMPPIGITHMLPVSSAYPWTRSPAPQNKQRHSCPSIPSLSPLCAVRGRGASLCVIAPRKPYFSTFSILVSPLPATGSSNPEGLERVHVLAAKPACTNLHAKTAWCEKVQGSNSVHSNEQIMSTPLARVQRARSRGCAPASNHHRPQGLRASGSHVACPRAHIRALASRSGLQLGEGPPVSHRSPRLGRAAGRS